MFGGVYYHPYEISVYVPAALGSSDFTCWSEAFRRLIGVVAMVKPL